MVSASVTEQFRPRMNHLEQVSTGDDPLQLPIHDDWKLVDVFAPHHFQGLHGGHIRRQRMDRTYGHASRRAP